MKSLLELEEVRNRTLNRMSLKSDSDSVRIVVGMATCGIAAGARPVMDTLVRELKRRNIDNVNVTITGCIGVCRLEPVVEVIDAAGNRVTYVKMTSDKAERIIAEHIANGRVCSDYTIGAEYN